MGHLGAFKKKGIIQSNGHTFSLSLEPQCDVRIINSLKSAHKGYKSKEWLCVNHQLKADG